MLYQNAPIHDVLQSCCKDSCMKNADRETTRRTSIDKEMTLCKGYWICTINYTENFFGTLGRRKPVDILVDENNLREKATFARAIGNDKPAIPDYPDSGGAMFVLWNRQRMDIKSEQNHSTMLYLILKQEKYEGISVAILQTV